MMLFLGILSGLAVCGLMVLLQKYFGSLNVIPNPTAPAVGPRQFTAVSPDQYAEILTLFVEGKPAGPLRVSHLHDLSEGLTLTHAEGGIMLRVSFLPLKEAPRVDQFLSKISALGLLPTSETRTHVGEGSKVETLTLEWKALRDPLALQAQTKELLTLLQGPPGASIYVLTLETPTLHREAMRHFPLGG